MTLYDLFTGHFTWLGLLQEIGPLLIAAVSAFFAGYWHGRVVELQCWIGKPQKLREAAMVVNCGGNDDRT